MTTHTLTGNLGSLIGGTLTAPSGWGPRAFAIPYAGSTIESGEIRIGAIELTLDASQAFSQVLTDGGYQVEVWYWDPARSKDGPTTWRSGFFNLVANADLATFVANNALLYVIDRGVLNHSSVSGATPLDGSTDHELNLTGNTQVTLTGPVGVEIGLFVHFNGFTLTVNGQAVVASDPGTIICKLWSSEWRIYVSSSTTGGVVVKSPTDIGNIATYWNPSLPSALTLDGSSFVTACADQSGLGYSIVKSGAGNISTTTVNSKTAILFDGSTKTMNHLSFPSGDGTNQLDVTQWLVVKMLNVDTSSELLGLEIAVRNETTGNTRAIRHPQGTGSTNMLEVPQCYSLNEVIITAITKPVSGTPTLYVSSYPVSGAVTQAVNSHAFFGGGAAQFALCAAGVFDKVLSGSEYAGLRAWAQGQWGAT